MATKTQLWKTCGLSLVMVAAACGTPEEQGEPVDPALAAAIETGLSSFNSNPQAFMDARPAKFGANESQPLTATTDAVTAKDSDFGVRKDAPVLDPKADAPGSNDLARNLVDSLAVNKLADMDAQKLRSATLAESPWSDDYWGLYAGSLAKRYADSSFSVSDNWKTNTDQLAKAPSNLDLASPAEKWDRLVGDAGKSMTTFNINTGKVYADASGKVETWMGICHGWAPAAFMVPRPQKTVTVTAADGTAIKFYPSDLKALSSELWANARNVSTRFIGGRCNVKNPAKDAIGRITDQACRDTNAGTFHLAIVNQIGKAKRGFVLDATFDYEVWNQPAYGYSYTYFNPKTNKVSTTLSGATVARTAFTEDKFAKYRAATATSIVGVSMDVKWVVETRPSTNSPDSPARDAISGARYLYTLELDKDGVIVGGEWLQNAHPDFLWTPVPGGKPTVSGDPGLAAWDGKTALPANVRAAATTPSKSGLPLPSVLDALIKLSRQ